MMDWDFALIQMTFYPIPFHSGCRLSYPSNPCRLLTLWPSSASVAIAQQRPDEFMSLRQSLDK